MLGAFSNAVVSANAVREMRMFQSIQGNSMRCPEQCRVDAIAVLTELENEPNCLDSGFPVRRHISFILS